MDREIMVAGMPQAKEVDQAPVVAIARGQQGRIGGRLYIVWACRQKYMSLNSRNSSSSSWDWSS